MLYNTFNWVIVIKLSKTHQEFLDTAAGLYTSFFATKYFIAWIAFGIWAHLKNNIELKLYVTRIQIFRYSLLQFQPVLSKFFV